MKHTQTRSSADIRTLNSISLSWSRWREVFFTRLNSKSHNTLVLIFRSSPSLEENRWIVVLFDQLNNFNSIVDAKIIELKAGRSWIDGIKVVWRSKRWTSNATSQRR